MNSIEDLKLVFCIIAAIGLIIFNGWSLYTRKHCTKEVQEVCLKRFFYKGRYNTKVFAPLMRYEINGKVYERTSIGASGSGSQWFWAIGKKYKIYVNEKNPKYFVFDHKIILEDFALGLIGFGGVVISLIIWMIEN